MSAIQTVIFNIPFLATLPTIVAPYLGLVIPLVGHVRGRIEEEGREFYSPLFTTVEKIKDQVELTGVGGHIPWIIQEELTPYRSSFRYHFLKGKPRKALDDLISLIKDYDDSASAAKTVAGQIVGRVIRQVSVHEGELILWGKPKLSPGSGSLGRGPDTPSCLALGIDPVATFEKMGSGYIVESAQLRLQSSGVVSVDFPFPEERPKFAAIWGTMMAEAGRDERIQTFRTLSKRIPGQLKETEAMILRKLKRKFLP